MRRFYIIIGLSILAIILSSSGGSSGPPYEEESLSYYLITEEIDNSLKENKKQENLINRQTGNTSTETLNNQQWKKYKETAQKIQDRLRIVDFTLQAIPSGYVILQKSREIKNTQRKILTEIQSAPQSLKEVLPNQIKFVDDLQMVIRFLAGIVLSYGAINQMEKAERQILLNYALSEVDNLANSSFNTLMLIRMAKEQAQRRKSMLDYYINRDKELVEEFLKNLKKL